MNPRIQELSEQAGINVIPRRPYIDEEPDGYLESDNDFVKNNHEVVVKLLEGDALKKFAELIVRECADIAQQHNKSPVAAPLAIGYVIREHFGVEE
jgi:predicted RNA-binding protein with RPS1 domain